MVYAKTVWRGRNTCFDVKRDGVAGLKEMFDKEIERNNTTDLL